MEQSILPSDMEDLPVEIKLNIIYFLDDRSARALRLANEDWCRVINDTYNFNFYYTTNSQFDQIVQRLKKYNFPIRISFTHHKLALERKHFEELSKLTQLISINTRQIIPTTSDVDFEPLTALTNLETVPFGLPDRLLTSFVNLTQLKLYAEEKESIVNLRCFSKLISLSWMFGENVKLTQVADPLHDIQCPHLLTALTIQNGRSRYLNTNFERFSSLKQLKFLDYQFVAECKLKAFPTLPNLEALMLRTRNFIPLISLTNLTNLELRFSTTDQQMISTLATLTKLQILRMSLSNLGNIDDFQFMTALTSLECFGYSVFQQQDLNECPILPYIIGPKLTRLEAYPILNLNHLTHLSSIMELKINSEVHHSQQLLKLSVLTSLEMPIATIEDVKIIEQMTGLKSLTLCTNKWPKVKFQVDKLVHLEGLRCLGLYQQLYLDEKNLRHLPLKKLEIMMRIKGKVLKSISNITTLETLILHDVSIGDKKLPYLRSLSHLTNLQMNFQKKVSGVILTSLTSLQYLEIFYHKTFDVDEETLKMKLPRLWHCEVTRSKSVVEMLHE